MTETTQATIMRGTSALRRVVALCVMLGLVMTAPCQAAVDSGFGDSAGFVLNTQDNSSAQGTGYADSGSFALNTQDNAFAQGTGYADSGSFALNTQGNASAQDTGHADSGRFVLNTRDYVENPEGAFGDSGSFVLNTLDEGGEIGSGYGDSGGFVLNTQGDDIDNDAGPQSDETGYGDSGGFALDTLNTGDATGSGYGDSGGFVLNTQDSDNEAGPQPNDSGYDDSGSFVLNTLEYGEIHQLTGYGDSDGFELNTESLEEVKNEPPTDLALDNATIAENGGADAVVGRFILTDPWVFGDPEIITEGVGEKVWEFNTSFDPVWSDPALGPDGTLYIGSDDRKVYAVNGDTGVKKWEFETGNKVQSSAAVGADGTVYIGSTDGKMYALDGSDGTKLWEFDAGETPSLPAIGVNGTVYLGGGGFDGKVYALAGDTGVKEWEFGVGEYVSTSPAIGADGTVYFGANDGRVYALAGDTGVKKWEFETDTMLATPAIGSDGTVYFGANLVDNSGLVYALDGASGTQKWKIETAGEVWASPSIGTDGTVYIGSKDGKVYALTGSDGTQKWEFATGGAVNSTPAIGFDGTVYVGSGDGKVYALDESDGTKKWELATAEAAAFPYLFSPVIDSGGRVYFGLYTALDGGSLWALQGSSGPARSPWAMQGQNAQRTARAKPQPTYALVAGAGDTDNAAFSIDGGNLRLTVPADFEAKASYSVRVQGTDTGGLSFAKALTVIVQESGPTDNYSTWITENGLAALAVDKQALDADPDGDGLANLIEYALGKNPVAADAHGITPDISSGSLSITFVRVKASIDANLTYKVELATTLSDWVEASVTINGALQGVDQTGLPDGNDFATSKYERVKATANTDMAGSSGKQFLRMTVEK